jgi:PPOX class probable F420-dependent enzyme
MARPDISEPARRLLEENVTGVLTTIRHSDGLPSTNPVGYIWDGAQVRISTLKSRVKYRNLCANTAVAFCVISPKDNTKYVEVRGRATLEEDPDRVFLREQFRHGTGMDPPEDLDPPGSERVIITIDPEQVSCPVLYGGRFSRSDGN